MNPIEIERSALFEKLNPLCFKAAESATALAKIKQHNEVEIAHWLLQLLKEIDSDISHLLPILTIPKEALQTDLEEYINTLTTSKSTVFDFSWVLEKTIERAWLLTSLFFNEPCIRSGHLLIALLESKPLRPHLQALSNHFKTLNWPQDTALIKNTLEQAPEQAFTHSHGANLTQTDSASIHSSHQALLQQFTIDMTEQAKNGEIDCIIGRDAEIRQMINILLRRRQNNPLITGEAGVGKTALVEGLAHKIAQGDVPPALKNSRLLMLDLGLLQAGASLKGQFEERLKSIIKAIEQSATPILLFIDEAHTLMGAGGQAGTNDAANLLKPPLARGLLKTIAATTWDEYKKHIEKDPALTRRFEVIPVAAPSIDNAINMLRHACKAIAQHHGVLILDEAIEAAVTLSERYIPSKQLPDKAVSLLDTACAKTALSHHTLPVVIDDILNKLTTIETQLEQLNHETQMGFNQEQRCQQLLEQKQRLLQQKSSLQPVWEQEKQLLGNILDYRQQLAEQAHNSDCEQQRELQQALHQCQTQLSDLQQTTPLLIPEVSRTIIMDIVEDWTGIPVRTLDKERLNTLLNLNHILGEQIIGQTQALEAISLRVQTSRANLENPNKPVGVFLLAGPSGVGKTQTAIALANTLYGGEQNLITINMSEFQEAHTVSTLKGSPPGYVGYGEGGILTEAVRRKPYSVVLLDEVEKAHKDVHELFFQVFDKGIMEDAEGRTINFKNNLILLTTNVGSELLQQHYYNQTQTPNPEQVMAELRQQLLQVFPAALLGRMVILPYQPLNPPQLKQIIIIALTQVGQRLKKQGIAFHFTEQALERIIVLSDDQHSGGRMIDNTLTQFILPAISQQLLRSQIAGQVIEHITLDADQDNFTYQFEGSEVEEQEQELPA